MTMQPVNIILLMSLVLLMSCAEYTDFLPSQAEPCDRPVLIPDRPLNDREIELYWGQDRNELLKCSDKVETLSGRS